MPLLPCCAAPSELARPANLICRRCCVLTDRVFITNQSNDAARARYLLLLSPYRWKSLLEDLRKPNHRRRDPLAQRPFIDGKTAASFYLDAACERKIDRRGRVSIPQRLRDFAELKRDAVMLELRAELGEVQLWQPETFRRCLEEVERCLFPPEILRRGWSAITARPACRATLHNICSVEDGEKRVFTYR
jgi:DNA-binding transcriptional regulator/RsmH inhibitor MraZ